MKQFEMWDRVSGGTFPLSLHQIYCRKKFLVAKETPLAAYQWMCTARTIALFFGAVLLVVTVMFACLDAEGWSLADQLAAAFVLVGALASLVFMGESNKARAIVRDFQRFADKAENLLIIVLPSRWVCLMTQDEVCAHAEAVLTHLAFQVTRYEKEGKTQAQATRGARDALKEAFDFFKEWKLTAEEDYAPFFELAKTYVEPPKPPVHPDFFSFDETLKEAGISEERLKRLVSEGEIRAFREGDQMKFRRKDVEEIKEAYGVRVVAAHGPGDMP